MTIYRLGDDLAFPPPSHAEASGLLAVGGDLSPERLMLAYSSGIFPWPLTAEPLLWFSPDPRMVLLPDELRVGRSLRKRMRQRPFEIRFDTAFGEVVRCCAEVQREGESGTWITGAMKDAYVELHHLGFAHSAEAFCDGALVGGLYGVGVGRCFAGESMFAVAPDASKIAFVVLVRHLQHWGYRLIDCQVHTDHLERFGAREWPRSRFLDALGDALKDEGRLGPWRADPTLGGSGQDA